MKTARVTARWLLWWSLSICLFSVAIVYLLQADDLLGPSRIVYYAVLTAVALGLARWQRPTWEDTPSD